MALVYFGVDVGGQGAADVTVDSSTTGLDVELVVDDAAVARAAVDAKDKIDMAMRAIAQKLEQFDY